MHHLEQISQVLQDNSHLYIVRHLYHPFSQDVAALAQDRELLDLKYYLDLGAGEKASAWRIVFKMTTRRNK